MLGDSFDAVYYAGAAPSSLESLTLLALVFDKIYFPGVKLPLEDIDKAATIERIDQLRALPRSDDVDNATHVNLSSRPFTEES